MSIFNFLQGRKFFMIFLLVVIFFQIISFIKYFGDFWLGFSCSLSTPQMIDYEYGYSQSNALVTFFIQKDSKKM